MYNTHVPLYSVQYTLKRTVYNAHVQLYSIQCTCATVQCTIDMCNCTVYNAHVPLYNVCMFTSECSIDWSGVYNCQ